MGPDDPSTAINFGGLNTREWPFGPLPQGWQG